jgi:hypothetical protein
LQTPQFRPDFLARRFEKAKQLAVGLVRACSDHEVRLWIILPELLE